MTAISVNGLGLVYEVPGRGLGGRLSEMIRRRPAVAARPSQIEALRDVSFTLSAGDRLALLGLNGAGKTTLLKVLAGIYQPTRGTLVTDGTVAPLFDVGLGMDGDLTGRQNLVARGLFLGLTQSEIAEVEHEIIEFTGLEPHIDLPVSTYSAGMYIRLAFAVVTSLTPEILLLDEGVGVGDAEFRDRAERRMDSFLKRAGILVFSSHDFALVHRYCDQALVLHEGSVIFHGPIDDGVECLSQLVRDREHTWAPEEGS